MKKLNIYELVSQLDMMFEENSYFIDISTGKIIEIENRFLEMAEEGEDGDIASLLGWEKKEISLAENILTNKKDMVSFPNKYEIDEYHIIEDFSESYSNEYIRIFLLEVIKGRGAFRRFKNAVHNFNIEKEWYKYKDSYMLKFAKEWCEINEIEYIYGDADYYE